MLEARSGAVNGSVSQRAGLSATAEFGAGSCDPDLTDPSGEFAGQYGPNRSVATSPVVAIPFVRLSVLRKGLCVAGPVERRQSPFVAPNWALTRFLHLEEVMRTTYETACPINADVSDVLDSELRGLCRHPAHKVHGLRHRLVAFQALDGHARLGFASIREYGEPVLGMIARETRECLHFGRGLHALPRLDAALEAGQVGWSAVRSLARIVTPTPRQPGSSRRRRTPRASSMRPSPSHALAIFRRAPPIVPSPRP